MRTYRSLVALAVLLASPAFAQSQRRDNPTVRETLRWMQTTLESGAGDYSVFHEVRSVRLEDFIGCKVHFSYSTHQEPYANGAPAPEPNKTYRVDYFFGLGNIDPTNITFSKGSGLHASDDGVYESPSFLTIRTRNDEKKITIKLPWQSEADSRPEDTSLILSLDSVDQDYIARFAKAFKHAVEACGSKPSLFADSHAHGSDEQAPAAAGAVAARSAPPRKGTQDPWAVVSQTPVVAMRSAPPPKDIPAIAKAANGAVVSIVMSDKDGNPIALGSGFLVSKDGIIITNYHVIAEGTSALVKLPDGAFYVVDGVIAFDKARDVAVIKAHGENFRTLTLGDSDRVQVGQEVVAIGNPLSLESTVSNGIVSSIRTIEDKGGKYLQITAPISPGSSGGPLFDMAGEVIGITTMYIKGGENLNFAIPINDAKPLLLQASSAKLQNLPNQPEPTEAQTHEGNAPPSPPSPAAPAAQTPAAARDFFERLNDAGGFSDDPVEYVCFSDDQDSDAFFTFGAAAYDERYARAATPPSATYIHFLSDDDMKDLSRGEQKFFRKGGRTLLQYVYEKGVKVDTRRYDWIGSSWRSSIQTGPWTFAIRQLSIEPETMRYIQMMKTEITGKGTLDDHAEDGVCEKILNPK